MTLRERFLAIMRFQNIDRLPYVELTNHFRNVYDHRWIKEGMPEAVNPFEYFGFDEASNERATNWLNQGRGVETITLDQHALPRFENRRIEPQGEFHYTVDVRTGQVFKRLAARSRKHIGVKHIVDCAVKTPGDWLEVKKRYEPHTSARYPRLRQYEHHLPIYPAKYPETWEEVANDSKKADHIIMLRYHPGFSYVSNAVGFERLLMSVIEEPQWIHEMVDHFGLFTRELYRKALGTARIDFIDLNAAVAPPRTAHGELLISPEMYLDYDGDNYRQYLEMAAHSGVQFAELPHTRHRAFEEQILRIVSDAGLTPIIPADAEGEFGLAKRKAYYGNDLPIRGGLEVRPLTKGRDAIDRMIETFFAEADKGGVFPTLIDRYGGMLEVPLDNYTHYTRAYRKANGMN